jgi:hypothetical protein
MITLKDITILNLGPNLDAEELKEAGRYLRKHVITAFVQKVDNLEILPIDSRGLSIEFHRHGINMRYLGQFIPLISAILNQ